MKNRPTAAELEELRVRLLSRDRAGRIAGLIEVVDRLTLEQRFQLIDELEVYSVGESRSGAGSDDAATVVLRRELPLLLERRGVTTILDAPCGDCHWMRQISFCERPYVGVDIVPAVVARNQLLYGSPTVRFAVADLTTSELPEADLILCRDALVHLADADVWAVLRNIARARARWLLTTTFDRSRGHRAITSGDFRPLALEAEPFGLPSPCDGFLEDCNLDDGRYRDKRLALWEVAAIRDRLGELGMSS